MILTGVFVLAAALVLVMSQTGLLTPEIKIKDGQAPLAFPDFVEDSGILYPIMGNNAIIVGETWAGMLFRNPEGNDCYLTFEIILEETGESLYLSESIAPSAYIEEQRLARALPEGRYAAGLTIRAFDPVNKTEIGSKTEPFELVVTASRDP